MRKNGIFPTPSARTCKLTLALAIGLLTGSISVSAADKQDSFCQSAGEKNGFDCSKAQSFQAKQSDIEAKLKELNRWITDEASAQNAPLAKTEQPDSDKLREKMEFNAQLLAIELKQAKKLQNQGDLKGAFDQVNRYLVSNPKDPNGWLLYGISLINQNKLDEAADIFTKLTHLYPDSPEPYNNLAVVYARKGENETAVELLLKAFETHPSYAQVQANLKSVYAALATQAYNRALNLDNSKQPPRADLGVLDQVYPTPSSQQILAYAAPQVTSVKAQPAQSQSEPKPETASEAQSTALVIEERAPSEATVPAPVSAQATAQPQNNADEKKAAPTPTATETVVQTSPEVKPDAGSMLSESVKTEVESAIADWASSWSSQNVDTYLSFYTSDFTPDNNITHKQWVWGRQQRLSKPSFIKVEISDLSLAEAGNGQIRSVFRQRYQSDTYQDEVYKTLTLIQENGHWKITSETTL